MNMFFPFVWCYVIKTRKDKKYSFSKWKHLLVIIMNLLYSSGDHLKYFDIVELFSFTWLFKKLVLFPYLFTFLTVKRYKIIIIIMIIIIVMIFLCFLWKCSWRNYYHGRNQRLEFKSRMKLFIFHNPRYGNKSKRKKSLNSNRLKSAWNLSRILLVVERLCK